MWPVLQEVEGKRVTYVCAHWRSFPPRVISLMQQGKTAEDLRNAKLIPEDEYQRYLVWKNNCGLLQMNLDKCLHCPLIRTASYDKRGLPVLVTLDGKLSVPAIDLPTLEVVPRHRKALKTLANRLPRTR